MNATPATDRARLFVALDPPAAVRRALGDWGKAALADPALRVVPAESLHLTLAFLGQRPLAEVERIVAAMAASEGPAPLAELGDPVAKPARGRPRLFALPVLSPGAEVMQASLVEQLVAAGLYEPEERPFWPHLTVARVRSEGRGSRRPMLVQKPPTELSPSLREAFYGVRVCLYRSQLQPSGARYVPLAQIELSGAGQQ